MQDSMRETIAALAGEMRTLRRDIHRHPELAYREQRTAALVAERLRAWGIEIFAPKYREGRYNQFTNTSTYVSNPLFPRYVFARFDAERQVLALMQHVFLWVQEEFPPLQGEITMDTSSSSQQ